MWIIFTDCFYPCMVYLKYLFSLWKLIWTVGFSVFVFALDFTCLCFIFFSLFTSYVPLIWNPTSSSSDQLLLLFLHPHNSDSLPAWPKEQRNTWYVYFLFIAYVVSNIIHQCQSLDICTLMKSLYWSDCIISIIHCIILFLWCDGVQAEDMRELQEKACEMENSYGHWFDVVITHSDLNGSVFDLLKHVNKLDTEPQWVPYSWVCWRLFLFRKMSWVVLSSFIENNCLIIWCLILCHEPKMILTVIFATCSII